MQCFIQVDDNLQICSYNFSDIFGIFEVQEMKKVYNLLNILHPLPGLTGSDSECTCVHVGHLKSPGWLTNEYVL